MPEIEEKPTTQDNPASDDRSFADDRSSPPDFPPDPHMMDFVVLMAGRKWIMLGIVLFFSIGAFGMTYLMPQTFQSMAVLLPPDRISSSNLLSKYNSGFAIEMLKEVENPSVDLLQNILESRSLAERLAKDSVIHRYYSFEGLQGAAMVLAIEKDIKVGPGFSKMNVTGIIETGWFPSPAEKEQARQLSSYIANAAISVMDSTLKSAIRSLAHSALVYADSDYVLKRQQLDSLDARQQAFEQEHGVVKLETQTAESLDRFAELKAERDQAEIQLHLLALDLSESATSREAAVAKLNEAEQTATAYETEHQIGPSLDSLPGVSREYAEILRDRKELEPIVSFLRIETEQQRIFEVREKSLITVLDPARPPDTRISPIRSQMGFLGLIVGFALSIVYVAIWSVRIAWTQEKRSRRMAPEDVVNSASRIFAHKKT